MFYFDEVFSSISLAISKEKKKALVKKLLKIVNNCTFI